MAMRRLLALAASATVAADVVQVVVLCDSRTAAGRAECDVTSGLGESSWSRVSNVAWHA